jgi:glycosyltransferase involved in cell wall biosynthesis
MSAAARIDVSVVIPCYNGARFLRETLASVWNQTHPAFEVIVVDDGSKDDSATIAESFGPPVRVIRQSNQGESVARNRGIDEARGDWIAFLDADDLWHATKLARQVAVLTDRTLAVCTAAHLLDDGTGRITRTWLPTPESFTPDAILGARGCPCLISSLLVRADAPARFPTWTRHGEDLLYLLELARVGSIEIIFEPLATYRVHARSQSQFDKGIRAKWHESIDRWVIECSGIMDPVERDRLRGLAAEQLLLAVEDAYWRRDWAVFDPLRAYVESRCALPGADRALRFRRYARWLYPFKDFLDARRRPRANPSSVR